MINPQKPVINLIKMFNHFTALAYTCCLVRVCVGGEDGSQILTYFNHVNLTSIKDLHSLFPLLLFL